MDDQRTVGTDNRESVSEGYFKLSINTNKNEFKKGEEINCWVELLYIGEKDSITVYTYGSPIGMEMFSDKVSYSSEDNDYSDEQDMLTLKKGIPVRVTLKESIPKSLSVLPGQYEIDAYASLSLSPDGGVMYNGYVSAVITVKG